MKRKQKLSTQSCQSRYGRLASVYEYGAWLGSNGKIQESKHFHLKLIEKGARVLYPGPGWGLEIKEAVKNKIIPTMVEWDPQMFNKANKNLSLSGLSQQVECINDDILNHRRNEYYDYVVANYFLDVFPQRSMLKIFSHLVSLLKPNGKIFLSGYAPLMGSAPHKIIQWINYFYANIFCKIAVNNAIHGIYDYELFYKQIGLTYFCHHDFRHFGNFGPKFHRVWVASKTNKKL